MSRRVASKAVQPYEASFAALNGNGGEERDAYILSTWPEGVNRLVDCLSSIERAGEHDQRAMHCLRVLRKMYAKQYDFDNQVVLADPVVEPGASI